MKALFSSIFPYLLDLVGQVRLKYFIPYTHLQLQTQGAGLFVHPDVEAFGGHTPNESLELDSMPLAIKRAAILIYRLSQQ